MEYGFFNESVESSEKLKIGKKVILGILYINVYIFFKSHRTLFGHMKTIFSHLKIHKFLDASVSSKIVPLLYLFLVSVNKNMFDLTWKTMFHSWGFWWKLSFGSKYFSFYVLILVSPCKKNIPTWKLIILFANWKVSSVISRDEKYHIHQVQDH